MSSLPIILYGSSATAALEHGLKTLVLNDNDSANEHGNGSPDVAPRVAPGLAGTGDGMNTHVNLAPSNNESSEAFDC